MAPPIANSTRPQLLLLVFLSALIASSLGFRSARAQGTATGVRAQELFDEARALMKEKRYGEACSKLAESQTLDPGGGTILNLGICRRYEGLTATAWNILNQALAQARSDGRPDRERTAQKQLDALLPVLSRLTISLSPDAHPPGLAITLDAVPFDTSLLGSAVPLDPGPHEIKASASGHVPWSVTITLGPVADQKEASIPALEPEPAAPPTSAPAPTPPEPPKPATAQPPAKSSASPSTTDPLRPVGYAAIGVGVAALGVGTYFGLQALSLKADSNSHWDGTHCTQSSCVDDWNDAQTAALVSTIGVGVGLAGLGVGTYLLLRPTAKEPSRARAKLVVRPIRSGAFVAATASF